MNANDKPGNIDAWMRTVEATLARLDSRVRGVGGGVPALSASSQVDTTNGSGLATFTFGVTYPTPPVVIVTGGNDEAVAIHTNTVTTTGFTAVFRNAATGALLTGTLVRCNWVAVPATT